MKIWLILAAFLLIGGFLIARAHQIDLQDDEDRTTFLYEFARWIFALGNNAKSTVGHAIALDWLPQTTPEPTSLNESNS